MCYVLCEIPELTDRAYCYFMMIYVISHDNMCYFIYACLSFDYTDLAWVHSSRDFVSNAPARRYQTIPNDTKRQLTIFKQVFWKVKRNVYGNFWDILGFWKDDNNEEILWLGCAEFVVAAIF